MSPTTPLEDLENDAEHYLTAPGSLPARRRSLVGRTLAAR